MDVKEYITSGELELYVAGLLSEKENEEIHALAEKHPEIRKEIDEIEKALQQLSKTSSPKLTHEFSDIIRKIILRKQTTSSPKTNVLTYIGWVAAAIFAGLLISQYYAKLEVNRDIQLVEEEKNSLQEKVETLDNALEDSHYTLNRLRSKDSKIINLQGQEAAPEAYAKVIINTQNEEIYIDAKGLPKPPQGMVYQVWSLTLEPLTPTSIGLLEDFSEAEESIFTLNNPNSSEAFGITLEPEGGSKTPTLAQLYTLGIIQS